MAHGQCRYRRGRVLGVYCLLGARPHFSCVPDQILGWSLDITA